MCAGSGFSESELGRATGPIRYAACCDLHLRTASMQDQALVGISVMADLHVYCLWNAGIQSMNASS